MGDAVMKKGADEQRQQSTKGCSLAKLRNAAAACFFLHTYRTFLLCVKLYELTLLLCRGVYLYLTNALLIVC